MSTPPPTLLAIAVEFSKKNNLKDVTFAGMGAYKETFKVTSEPKAFAALKLLNPAKCNLERSEREIDAMKRCDSPHIAKLYESGEYLASDGVKYMFSMEEYLDGKTLTDKLGSNLSVDTVRRYGICLATALKHLNELRLVHRDIKPDNIMFRANSDDPVLVDFGLVRNLAETSLTQTWLPQGPGTPYYSAPEQLNNKKNLIDWRTDQFSLAIVLGICLTGQHPFARTNPAETVIAISQRRNCTSHFQIEAVKLGFSNLLKMMQPWPIHRFQTPDDLLASF